jgi:hypothetical protein
MIGFINRETVFYLIVLSIAYLGQEQASSMENMVMPPRSTSIKVLNGSGTSWLPQASSMYAIQTNIGKWTAMNHGSVYLRWTDQNFNNPDKRGESALDAPNWIMSQWDHLINTPNELRFRGMISLDPLTEGNDGYPLLFQTGEAFKGKPLIDRQHPHDLFMELSATWFYHFSNQNGMFGYIGYPGEPALGPTTYMHRLSSDMNVDAPLGHHWQDATHITFGVLTAGMIIKQLKIDASIFTGREPDENRWNFDRPRFDSYSGRISYQFTHNLEGQISAGYLHSPETLHPKINQVRITGSLATVFAIASGKTISNSIIYGGNFEIEHGSSNFTSTVLVEAEIIMDRWIPYARYEYVQKKGRDLGIAIDSNRVFNSNELTGGVAFRILEFASLSLFTGAQGTMNPHEKGLNPEYGALPLSYEIFIRIRPSLMKSSDMSKTHQ